MHKRFILILLMLLSSYSLAKNSSDKQIKSLGNIELQAQGGKVVVASSSALFMSHASVSPLNLAVASESALYFDAGGTLVVEDASGSVTPVAFGAEDTSVLFTNWASSTDYVVGDKVQESLKIYLASVSHTSGVDFASDSANWDVVSAAYSNYEAGLYYRKGELVRDAASNELYQVILDFEATDIDSDVTSGFLVLSSGAGGGIANWASGSEYEELDKVVESFEIFQASVAHTAAIEFASDSANWDIVSPSFKQYAENTFYFEGQLLKDPASTKLYCVINSFLSTNLVADELTSNLDQCGESSSGFSFTGGLLLQSQAPGDVIETGISVSGTTLSGITTLGVQDINASGTVTASTAIIENLTSTVSTNLAGVSNLEAVNLSASILSASTATIDDLTVTTTLIGPGVDSASVSISDFLQLSEISEGAIATPGSGDQRFFLDDTDKVLRVKDENALVYDQGKQFDNAFVPYKNANAELVNAFTDEYSTGQSATWGDSGTIGGTPSITTTGAELVNGDRAYKLLTPSNNDWVKSSQIPLPPSMRGKTLALNFQHKTSITSGTIRVYIKPQNLALASAVNYELELNSTGSFGSFVFFTGANDTYVEIGIQTTSPGAGYISWNKPEIVPFETQTSSSLDVKQSITHVANSNSLLDFNNEIRLNTANLTSVGDEVLIVEDDVANTRTKFIATQTTMVTVAYTAPAASTNNHSAILVNGSVAIQGSQNLTSTAKAHVSGGIKLNAGDYITVGQVDAGGTLNKSVTSAATPLYFYISAVTTSDVAVANNVKDNCSIKLYGNNGYGSSASKVQRFVAEEPTSSCESGQITYTDSATNGASFTLNVDGVYHIDLCTQYTGSISAFPGFSLNSSSLTTNIYSLPENEILKYTNTSGTNPVGCVSHTGEFKAGDIVRPQSEGDALGTGGAGQGKMTVTLIGTEQKAGILLPQSCTFGQQQTSNTSEGGTFTSGSWQTRTLNYLTPNCSFMTISGNQAFVPSGTYQTRCEGVARQVNQHLIRLRDITGATTLALGTRVIAGTSDATNSVSSLEDTITLSAYSALELQHRSATTRATDGFGTGNTDLGELGFFARCTLTKIK